MDSRPELNDSISLEDFRDFYWLKIELQKFCKDVQLTIGGSKLELTERIEQYLQGESIVAPTKPKLSSRFDWKTEDLSLETLITDSYKNSENVRQFFEKEIGSQFKFNIAFMRWMKSSSGKTLSDAVDAWHQIFHEVKNRIKEKEIAPQFEYNTYVRDFLKANKELSKMDAIKCWKVKRNMRGTNQYEQTDLKFLSSS